MTLRLYTGVSSVDAIFVTMASLGANWRIFKFSFLRNSLFSELYVVVPLVLSIFTVLLPQLSESTPPSIRRITPFSEEHGFENRHVDSHVYNWFINTPQWSYFVIA